MSLIRLNFVAKKKSPRMNDVPNVVATAKNVTRRRRHFDDKCSMTTMMMRDG